jgi:anti-sigma regulatory factor (Ser/Thr protein kinase)
VDHDLDPGASGCTFRHETLFHTGDDGFVDGALPIMNAALAADDAILVAVSAKRIALLREALGEQQRRIVFADMQDLGANPARIIPAWQSFLDLHAAPATALGIGEPIWPGRSDAELIECQRHESLLNVAFGGGRCWRLVCPYDVGALDDEVIDAARLSHPLDAVHGAIAESAAADVFDPFAGVLPPPRAQSQTLPFSLTGIAELRGVVARSGEAAGLAVTRSEDLVLAFSELAANSVRYGGGEGTLELWVQEGTLMCEVRDRGHLTQPLLGRVRPDAEQQRGRGLWMVNQLCDLVQIRSSPGSGTTVRVHMHLP